MCVDESVCVVDNQLRHPLHSNCQNDFYSALKAGNDKTVNDMRQEYSYGTLPDYRVAIQNHVLVLEREWLRQAIPVRRSEAETAIQRMYQSAGHSPPSRIVWFLSPYHLLSNIHIISITPLVAWETKEIISYALDYSGTGIAVAERRDETVLRLPISYMPRLPLVYKEIYSPMLEPFLKTSFPKSVPSLYNPNVINPFWDAAIIENLIDSLQPFTMSSEVAAQFRAFWEDHGIIDYSSTLHSTLFAEKLSAYLKMPDVKAAFEGLHSVLAMCSCVVPTKDVCFVSEKHIKVQLDDDDRLHSDAGLALEYADGWGMYALHGMRIPAHKYQELARQETIW